MNHAIYNWWLRPGIVIYFIIELEFHGSNPPCHLKIDLKKKTNVKSISILILN